MIQYQTITLQASQRRVTEALHVVAEWEEAVTVSAETVMASGVL